MGPKEKAAIRRYNVYRNNVTVSLIDALAAVFPATQRLTGVEFFRAMARFYVRAAPPTSPLLFEYGGDFPDFIATYEYARSAPWLADVARVERAWLDAYHAADLGTLTPEALAAFPSDAARRRGFRSPSSNENSQLRVCGRFDVPREPDRRTRSGSIDATTPEDALITRPGLDVVVRRLPPGGAMFLKRLVSGETLAAAAAAAFEASASFDLSANIAGIVEAGAFTAIQHGDR